MSTDIWNECVCLQRKFVAGTVAGVPLRLFADMSWCDALQADVQLSFHLLQEAHRMRAGFEPFHDLCGFLTWYTHVLKNIARDVLARKCVAIVPLEKLPEYARSKDSLSHCRDFAPLHFGA